MIEMPTISSTPSVSCTAIVRCVVLVCAFAVLASARQFSQTTPVVAPGSSPTKPGSGVILSSPDAKGIIKQARQSYYDLKAAGLIEFRCDVLPDWDFVYKQIPGGQELLPILKKTHFQVVVGSSGASTVSHVSDVAPPSEAVTARVRTAVRGVEEVLTGFFKAWSQMAFTPPLPEVDDKYQLEDLGDKYRLTYRQGSTDVLMLMNRDFAIEEVNATAPQFSLHMRPKFASSKSGFQFVGYESSEQVGANKIPTATTMCNLCAPDGTMATRPVTVRLNFSHYRVKNRETSDRNSANISNIPNAPDAGKTGSQSGADLAQPGIPHPGTSETNSRGISNLEVLSDTRGVDFGSYLSRVVQAVRMNWYHLVPDEARAPYLKKGKVFIEFAILPDGRVAGMKVTGESGDVSLDRAAWGGVTASAPFQPLPSEFHGPYLALRFRFYYNPAPGDSEQVRLSEILIRTPQPYVQTQVTEAQRKANDVREAIRKGNSFAEMAKANSQGPTAAIGGELGCFSHGQLSEPLEQLVFSMTVGEVSDVVRTKQGFTILQVTNRGEHPCADWSY